ncbi:MAG: hypothetical protein RLZ04_33, partial [Actinomycetota bacterium]
FDVSETGVPVLVRISYFPSWKVEGAEGPYRVAPNFMVVVPTSTSVRLEYSSSGIDKGAWVLTLIGIGLLFVWRRRGDVVHANAHPYLVDDLDDESDDEAEWEPAMVGGAPAEADSGAGSPEPGLGGPEAGADDGGAGADPTPPAGSL